MISRLLNLIFPPQCLVCSQRVAEYGSLCLSCWNSVQFITEPMCDSCGLPFEYEIGKNALCGECLNERPIYARARAALRYDENSRKLITRFKYSDQTQLAKVYSAWLAAAGQELLTNTDIIIPVPLHYFRFIARRFNQSALLTQELARKTNLPCLLTAIKRTRHTKQQTGLSKNQRRENVKGAFSVNPRYAPQIRGKNILLVDDVYTTGSTIKQCSTTLLKAGVGQVNVLTLARAGR